MEKRDRDLEICRDLKSFEDIHKACHILGRDIILAHNSGDHERANKLLQEAQRNSERLNRMLGQLKSDYLARHQVKNGIIN